MNLVEYITIGLASATLLLAVGGVIYNAGRLRESQESAEADMNGIGQKIQRLAIVVLARLPEQDREELMKFVLLGTPRKG